MTDPKPGDFDIEKPRGDEYVCLRGEVAYWDEQKLKHPSLSCTDVAIYMAAALRKEVYEITISRWSLGADADREKGGLSTFFGNEIDHVEGFVKAHAWRLAKRTTLVRDWDG